MTGFFSVRVAPGLRISASRRGLRTHVGPRGARLHLGGGGPGVSTGAGPFTYYHPLCGGGRGGSSAARAGAGSARQEKVELARELAGAIVQLEGIHRQDFPPALRPEAEAPTLPDRDRLVAGLARQHRQGTWPWQLTRRREARRRAEQEADQQLKTLRAQAREEQRAEQDRLDDRWQRLLDNDPDCVLATLAASFEDNQAPVAPVGVEDAEAHLVLLVPGIDAVPDRYPTTTQAGNLSIRTLSVTDRWELYRQLVAGHALVSAREAFAVAPGLERVTLVVLREEGDDVYGEPRTTAVLATRLDRRSLEGIRWAEVSAWEVIDQVGQETQLNTWGRARKIRPLDLTGQPDLAHVIDSVDVDELDLAWDTEPE